jgi:hypothetical protein
MKKKYTLIQDDSSHWYVIPQDKKEDWLKWLESEESENGIIPNYADSVGGCLSLVTFENYIIN